MIGIKNKKRMWPIVVIFIYYSQLFARVPKIGDRIMEQTCVLSLQNGWRYLLAQGYWIKSANIRILSNIFSAIFDTNVYISAIVNAFMIACICYICLSFCKEHKTIIVIATAILTLFLYKNGVNEVYFYAKTLYISAILLTLIYIKEYLKDERNYYILTALSVLGFFWLETVVVAILTVNAVGLVLSLIDKTIKKKQIIHAGLSIALLFMDVATVKLAAPGRFESVGKLQKNILIGGNLYDYALNNLVIVVVLTIAIIGMAKKTKLRPIAVCVSVFNSIFVMWGCIYKLYLIVSADLTVAEPMRWHPQRLQKLDNIQYKIDMWSRTAIGTIVITGYFIMIFLILVYICYRNDEKKMIYLLSVAYGQLLMYVLAFYNQPRIGTLSFFMFTSFGISCLSFSSLNQENIQRIIVLFTIVGLVKMWNYNIVIGYENEISKARKIIAEEVRKEQLLGKWNYDSVVNFPAYVSTVDGYFMGDNIVVYDSMPVRQEMLKKEYRLNVETKLRLY